MATKAELEAQLAETKAQLDEALATKKAASIDLGKAKKLNIVEAQKALGFRLSPIKITRDKVFSGLQSDIANLAVVLASVIEALKGEEVKSEPVELDSAEDAE